MENDGDCFLYVKTIERAHLPSQLWEKIPLGEDFKTALEIIDQNLMYWPESMINKVKQRFTKIWQYLIRMRKLRSKLRPKMVTINRKIERREKVREYKALVAAQVENQIKKELLERLAQNTYGEIYNFAPSAFSQVMDEQAEIEREEYVEGEYDDDFELEDDYSSDGLLGSDIEEINLKTTKESDESDESPKRNRFTKNQTSKSTIFFKSKNYY